MHFQDKNRIFFVLWAKMEYLSNRSTKMEYKKALEMAIRIWFIPKHLEVIIFGFSWIFPIRMNRIQKFRIVGGQYLESFFEQKELQTKKTAQAHFYCRSRQFPIVPHGRLRYSLRNSDFALQVEITHCHADMRKESTQSYFLPQKKVSTKTRQNAEN